MDTPHAGTIGAASTTPHPADLAAAVRHGELIDASRNRWADPEVRDRWTLRIGALAFLIPATAMAAMADWSSVHLGVLIGLMAALAVASTVELEIGSASAVPTEPIVVAMLLMLPAGVVPAAAFAGLLASTAYFAVAGIRRESPTVSACSSAFILGPAIVVQVVGLGPLGPRWWGVIALAFLAQIASDLLISWWRNCVGLGLPFGELVGMMRLSYSIDLLLVPGAVAAVMAVHGSPVAILFVLCPTLLMAFIAKDRAQHIDSLVSLGAAYSEATGEARRDALTGLGNRLAWDEAIAHEAATATGTVGIMMLDVDHLKWVNDRFGHASGDRLLTTVADVIKSICVEDTVACRLGGDEFGMLLVAPSTAELAQLSAVVTRALAQKPHIGDLPVSASIGFATAQPGHARDAVRDADLAMYRSKQLRGTARPVSILSPNSYEPAV